ncbi:uncharacterized protein N7482_006112 [Penicillium canariense]|uniref:Phosphoglycerate mutase family protein n=1 Tax=Penicillium canariense TaxID=189055 RepID=A0A9W9I3R4_9EURO|nr:uncharacterized protein N7482_006112 [Penicillium canariense]KAJ5167331.1 hypothetical protein N7482_006112 [Penicillium canariense]
MPLDTIYLTRHGHRLNWTIDVRTGTYKSQFPTPTGNPADPALTSHGVRQSHELAVHIAGPDFHPKPFRVYSSPFYRCLQTIQPSVEELRKKHHESKYTSNNGSLHGQIDPAADLDVRIENGLGEWFGPTTFFNHPSHPAPDTMRIHFPSLIPSSAETKYTPLLHPSTRGETIAQLHNRVATALEGIIADVDAEITTLEATLPAEQRTSKSILICAHAAPLIAMGRVLTGHMPEDSSEEDFYVFTAGLSTFKRRGTAAEKDESGSQTLLAEGTRFVRSRGVPAWQGGRGVGGGWDCVKNGDCRFLSGGAERGWHFNGEESFDTGPMAALSENTAPLSSSGVETNRSGMKL